MDDRSVSYNLKTATRKLLLKKDERGWLLKVLMRHHLPEEKREFGEIYVTAARPGEVKGNHYHRRTREWFCVVCGQGQLVTKNVATGETAEFILSVDEPHTIEVSPNVAHAVKNVGQDLMVLLAYADEPYDPDDPDEVQFPLLSAG